MTELNGAAFSTFFHELWGRPPFAWQRDLAQRVVSNTEKPWPTAIALPTASGKTACLDIALFAMAARSVEKDGGWITTAPRRLFFVVDRRVIVDEAFERARKIADHLRSATDGILFEVAERLRQLAGGNIPLMSFQLRGGMYRSDAWARSPLQPSIIATTVDQVGSRLLFRAYGRSAKAWPIQAGMTGNDALILLDEAHCSQPFMETLHSVEKYRQWSEAQLPGAFHVSILSATPPNVTDLFYDRSEEPQTKGHPLGKRQLAPKKALLKTGKTGGKKAREMLAGELVETAEALVDGRPLAAVLFVNYVATARDAHRLLSKKHGDCAILLTGRMRPIDKDDTISERLQRFYLASEKSAVRRLEKPVFVVATQTLEVGADLDFDVLVTECASLDALRQRFGRLNRMGREIVAEAAILMRPDLVKSSADDPVYGESLGKTWQWLNEQAGDEGAIDMGIAALSDRLPTGEALSELNGPTEHAPVMMPAHVDCWGQTMPEPFPSPEVSVFLHGPTRASADVQVCWRADIELTGENREKSLDVLALCPPAAAESLAVPIWVFRKWMTSDESAMDTVSDVEGASGNSDSLSPGTGKEIPVRHVIRWRGREESEVVSNPDRIRPGDVIIIPVSERGWEILGDIPGTAEVPPVLDWGDRAYAKTRAKAILRLHPAVLRQWPDHASKSRFIKIAEEAAGAFEEDPEVFLFTLKEALESLSLDDTAPVWLTALAANLIREPALKRTVVPHPLGTGVILRGREKIDPQTMDFREEEVDWFSDEDDAAASGTTYVSLEAHLKGVAGLARRFAVGCGLQEDVVRAMELAGRFHDTGKADPRFQALLRGGNPWAKGELLAKSEDIPQGGAAYRRAREAVGYPAGGRHELLSVRLAESASDGLPSDPEDRELILHLIQSHHGYCRPFAPVVIDSKPVMVSLNHSEDHLSAFSETGLERLDSGVPERFWRLLRRYGWWGLAWLETILRLADHRQSEHEEESRRKNR